MTGNEERDCDMTIAIVNREYLLRRFALASAYHLLRVRIMMREALAHGAHRGRGLPEETIALTRIDLSQVSGRSMSVLFC